MVTLDVLDLGSHSKKIRTDAEMLKKQSIILADKVQERDARATGDSAWLEAAREELASVKSKLSASRVEGASCGGSAHSITNGASTAVDDVSKALMAVLGEVADATKRKGAIIDLKLKQALKRVWPQIEMEPQDGILRI